MKISYSRKLLSITSSSVADYLAAHDSDAHALYCRSSGCGDGTCTLCQFNPSRICKRNLKQKYLIDDHLRAKCGAGLRVEVVDENGQCMTEPLSDMELEVRLRWWDQLGNSAAPSHASAACNVSSVS